MRRRTVCKIQPPLPEADINPVVIKMKFGVIIISRDKNYYCPFNGGLGQQGVRYRGAAMLKEK